MKYVPSMIRTVPQRRHAARSTSKYRYRTLGQLQVCKPARIRSQHLLAIVSVHLRPALPFRANSDPLSSVGCPWRPKREGQKQRSRRACRTKGGGPCTKSQKSCRSAGACGPPPAPRQISTAERRAERSSSPPLDSGRPTAQQDNRPAVPHPAVPSCPAPPSHEVTLRRSIQWGLWLVASSCSGRGTRFAPKTRRGALLVGTPA